jgi:hypothetical protein
MSSGIIVSHLKEVSARHPDESTCLTYRPLNGEETKEESKACVPPSSLVNNTIGTEDIASRVHLRTRGLRKQNDDDNCPGCHQ